jgi:hypothetical protein
MKTKITLRTKITLTIAGLLALTGILYAASSTQFSSGSSGVVGVAASKSDLIVSEYCSQNIDTVDCLGKISLLATIPGPVGPCIEKYPAIAPALSANAGFTPRDIFVTQGTDVYKIRGSTVTPFATIPGCAADHTGITFDHVGTFGYNMIVTCQGGGVWKVDGNGTTTHIADTGTQLEGPAVAPPSFGPFGGQILAADENNGQIHAIASDGTVTLDAFDWYGAEGVVVIPSAPCTFCSGGSFFQAIENFNAIYQYAPADFAGLDGSILVTSEYGSGTAVITWDGSNYNTAFFDNIPGAVYEGSSWADCDVPDATPTPTATATATATATPTATPTPTPTPISTSTPVCQLPTSITGNFNATAINAGRYIWFNSVLKPSGLPTNQPVTIQFTNQSITSSAFTLSVPDATVTFDPNATTATTSFVGGKLMTSVPVGLPGNALFSALSYLVPANIPGGIHNVSWSGTITSDKPGVSIRWNWAAAVYTSFSSDYNLLNVKPVDDNKASVYQNADHAGTPESFKPYDTGGATGGGASNYTGSLSSSVTVKCPQ